jgi:phosphoribosylformimino-5-aminoimidazole carboxamide ribotide isomerase
MVIRRLTSTFELLAAIDLRSGRVVRLEQGDFDRETAFPGDPSQIARTFVAEGITSLHVVDLDGARAGRPTQVAEVAAVIEAVGGRAVVEIAGGLRTPEDIAAAIDAGADRVVVGTSALRSPGFVHTIVTDHGSERIAVAVDVRDGLAVGEGWRDGATGVEPADLIRRLAEEGVATFEVTAIDRDGLLRGPDLGLLEGLVALGRGRVIASGGVASVDHIRAVRDAGCAGAIVGRALYDGRLTVQAALRA